MEQETYLAHHGVLGMKWGVRRYQNKDGSLTALGRKHVGQALSTKYDARKARYESTYSKAKSSKYSKSREKREENLKKQGLGDKQAAVRAYNEERAKKIIAVAAGVAVAAAVGYMGYKHFDANRDRLLKRDTPLYRISRSTGIHTDQFYAAYKKGDTRKYKGFYGMQLNPFGSKDVKIYQHKIDFGKDVKIMSENGARKTIANLLNEESKLGFNQPNRFKKDVMGGLEEMNKGMVGNVKQRQMLRRAYEDLKAGKTDTQAVYDSVNFMMVARGDKYDRMKRTVGDAVKKAGYDAIQDVNDKKLSGYAAKAPLIMFGNDAVKSTVREVPVKEVRKAAYGEAAKASAKSYALPVAAVVGTEVAYKYTSQANIIKAYKKDHPNTSLSDEDILKNYYS